MKHKDIVLKNFPEPMMKPEHMMYYYTKIHDGFKLGLIKKGCMINNAIFEVRETKTQFIIEFKQFRKCQKK